jgi:thioredoxin reductase
MQLVIVGAGPIGLCAALGARARGLEVTVLERGEVGESLRRWGRTRFFTPLGMNLPPRVRALLSDAPSEDALLTGPEMADRVLAPLAALPELAGRVRTHHRVLGVGRARMTRGELAGHPLRGERGFRLLVESPAGESMVEADRVIDASGVYGQPVALGSGGLAAPGERALAALLVRDLGRLCERLPFLHGKQILLAGHGASAANALALLAELAHADPSTRVTWAVRSANQRPCLEVADDPLPERRQVVSHANDLAQRPPPWLTVERRASVERLANRDDGSFAVDLSGGRQAIADEVVALTGYRPDLSLLSELALEISPSTEGTARLSRALSAVTDCLSVPKVAPHDLETGEPGFFLAGHKSYGRSRNFLLQTGYAQLETILTACAPA